MTLLFPISTVDLRQDHSWCFAGTSKKVVIHFCPIIRIGEKVQETSFDIGSMTVCACAISVLYNIHEQWMCLRM